MMPFVHEAIIDPIAAKLKRGEMPDTAGLVLVAAWGWGADSSSSYEALAKDMRALDPNTLHVYNGNYLHCTVATLSSFKNARSILYHASTGDRDRIVEAWIQALGRALARSNTLHSLELVFRSLKSSPAATFLEADDVNKAMTPLRAAVEEASCDPQIEELSIELERKYSNMPELCSLKEAVHIPGIVHSTIMRHSSAPSDARDLAKGLADLQSRWEPATVKASELCLVFEKHPYLHVSRADGEVHRFPLP